MYNLTEKTARQFEKFCRYNYKIPSNIKVGILSGEAMRDGKFIFPYENAIKLAQFNWAEKTKNRRKELYPNGRMGVEFKDYGVLLIRSINDKDPIQNYERQMELILDAFCFGVGARRDGLKKRGRW